MVEPADLRAALTGEVLIMPDEQVMRDLAADHRLDSGRGVVFDRTFLRWDRLKHRRAAGPRGQRDRGDELSRTLLGKADQAASRSSDWWRQVGAVAARGGTILGQARNRHHPTEYAPYLDGDPRDAFERGVRADLSTAIHAEAAVVAQAARVGTSLAGADLYVSTFPCPACARLIAEAGFRRCFFARPYSVLDGDRVLRAAGVELIWVDASAGPAGRDES